MKIADMDPRTLEEVARRVNRRAGEWAAEARGLKTDPASTAMLNALSRLAEAGAIADALHTWAKKAKRKRRKAGVLDDASARACAEEGQIAARNLRKKIKKMHTTKEIAK